MKRRCRSKRHRASGSRSRRECPAALCRARALDAARRCACARRRSRCEFPVGGERRTRVRIHRPGSEYYGRAPRPVEAAALAICLHAAPTHFYKRARAVIVPRPPTPSGRARGSGAQAPRGGTVAALARGPQGASPARRVARSPADVALQARQARARNAGRDRSLRGAADEPDGSAYGMRRDSVDPRLPLQPFPVRSISARDGVPSYHAIELAEIPLAVTCVAFRSTTPRPPRSTTRFRCVPLANGQLEIGIHIAAPAAAIARGRRWMRSRARACPRCTCPAGRSPCCPMP